MFRKIAFAALVAGAVLVASFVVAGRPLDELFGLTRAATGTALDGVADALPDSVRQKKLDQEVQAARGRLVDWQVKLALSERKIDVLGADVSALEGRVARRQTLLAEAYPVLSAAQADGQGTLRFASTEYEVVAFQQEVDELLLSQESDEALLEVKRESLRRLTAQLSDARQVVTDLRRELNIRAHEIAQLRLRGETADMEAEALAVVVDASEAGATSTELGRGLKHLREKAETAEARNEAVRSQGVGHAVETQLERRARRLERLKTIHQAARSKSDESPRETY